MRVIVLSAAFGALCLTGWAADDVNPAEIIQKFAAKESNSNKRATITPTARA